jgi:V/A-type H+-transporting ATPase subunit E
MQMAEKDIQKIIARIQADAKAKLETVAAEKQKEIDAINKDANQKISSEKTKLDEEFAKDTARIGKRMNSAARLEAKKMLLQAREEIIEGVFEKVGERLIRMPTEEYKAFLKSAIQIGKEQLGADMMVHCRQKNREIVRGSAGLGVKLEYKDLSHSSVGGILLESKQNGSVMNFLFDDIIERERPVLREEIGKVLYPGSADASVEDMN